MMKENHFKNLIPPLCLTQFFPCHRRRRKRKSRSRRKKKKKEKEKEEKKRSPWLKWKR
jgi:hypothetical protein